MGNSFVLFDVSIVIPHGQFHCGNRGYTQNTDFPWVKSHFPVGKRSSGTATIETSCDFMDLSPFLRRMPVGRPRYKFRPVSQSS